MIILHRPVYKYLGNIIVYTGPIRNGKSLLALFHGLLAIEDFKLERLVCNFQVDVNALRDACLFYWLPHAYKVFSSGQIYFVYEPNDLFNFKNALIIFDECGIYLNARDWASNKDFFKFLPQIGKGSINCHLFLICQYVDQLDFQAQQMIEFCWQVVGTKQYDLNLKMPRLSTLKASLMPSEGLGERNSRKTARQKIRERFILTKKRVTFKVDYLKPLFSCYNSADTVAGVPERGYFKKHKNQEIWQSDICRFFIDFPPFPVYFSLGKMLYVLLLRFGNHKPGLLTGWIYKIRWRVQEWDFSIMLVFFVLVGWIMTHLMSLLLWRFAR